MVPPEHPALLHPGRARRPVTVWGLAWTPSPAPPRRAAPAAGGGRPRRWATGRRGGQRFAIGVAARAGQRDSGRTALIVTGITGNRVGQRQIRLAALSGARIGHWPGWGGGLAGLRVGALRRQ